MYSRPTCVRVGQGGSRNRLHYTALVYSRRESVLRTSPLGNYAIRRSGFLLRMIIMMVNLKTINKIALSVPENLRPAAKLFLLEGLTRADKAGAFNLGRDKMAAACGITPKKMRRLLEILIQAKRASRGDNERTGRPITLIIENIDTYRLSAKERANERARERATYSSYSSVTTNTGSGNETPLPEGYEEVRVDKNGIIENPPNPLCGDNGDSLSIELEGYWTDGYGRAEGAYPAKHFALLRKEFGDEAVGHLCHDIFISTRCPPDADPLRYIYGALRKNRSDGPAGNPKDFFALVETLNGAVF